MLRNKAVGFTIVELVIVVVVLSILVAVSYITYNGSQQRARNAQTALAVKAYKDALILYRQDNGSYPNPTTAGTRVCLGNNYPSNQCWYGAGVTDTAFMSSLENVAGGKLPMPALPNLTLKGLIYISTTLGNRIDGSTFADATPVAFLVYSVEGDTTKCPIGPLASKPSNGNVYWWSSTAPSSGQSQAPTATNPPQCWVPLPFK